MLFAYVRVFIPKWLMKSLELANVQSEIGQLASVAPAGGEGSQLRERPSPIACEACVEVLHDLNNAFAGVLMNAQVLDCKLPSYSRSKRYIHEIERSAQRGSALLKRLLGHLAGECRGSAPSEPKLDNPRVPPVAERMAVVANQGPSAAEGAS
jgi:hypothetical protein